jgi:adenylate cyclase
MAQGGRAVALEVFSFASKDRLSALRHDLRNPLSEIIGFAEVLIEEAPGRNAAALLEGLEVIRQSAHRILADVNHALNPDTIRSSPGALNGLHETLQELGVRILEKAQQLSDQCDELGMLSMGEDLLRITSSARRLREIAPSALEALIAQGIDQLQFTAEVSRLDWSDGSTADTQQVGVTAGGAILVVDDQESNRALLSRRLQKEGYTVSLAENGRQALEHLRSRRFDLVLLDILMPEMDGMEVLCRIKADPQLAHIPVLMLSALDELSGVVRCIELGAADYLPKPFPPAILQARVQACLANKRMSDQLRKYTGWLFGKTLFSNAVSADGFMELTREERTILFADIRGFTAWSENHTPEETVVLLNRYFETAERIWAERPVIKSEYTGDEIMGVFPNALEAAEVAQAFRVELGRQLDESGLGIGIGLHTGSVIEGLMGGVDVKAYRFVGDTVNTAKRICTEARKGQVLLSATTFQQLEGALSVESPFGIIVKGKAQPLQVWPLSDSDRT